MACLHVFMRRGSSSDGRIIERGSFVSQLRSILPWSCSGLWNGECGWLARSRLYIHSHPQTHAERRTWPGILRTSSSGLIKNCAKAQERRSVQEHVSALYL
eukprot:3620180-Pleurochrysis_carterae.AAC.1